jgi:hypothetical protein
MQLNLMSAVFAVLTVLMLVCIMQEELEGIFQALFLSLLFATIPLFWSQALRAEVYTLHAFLMISVLYVWKRAHRPGQRKWYILCFVLLGLSMGNHPTTALLWGTLLVLLVWEAPGFRWLGIVGSALGAAIAVALYLYFPVRSAAMPAIDYLQTYFGADLRSIEGLWWLFSARMFQHALYVDRNIFDIVGELLRFGVLLWESFLGIGFVLGIWGWWRLRQKDLMWNRLLTIYFAANVILFALYHVVDKEVMFLPAFAIWTIWTAVGAKELATRLVEYLPQFPASVVKRATGGVLLAIVVLGIAFRWGAVSLHDNRTAYDYAFRLLEEVEPSTLVVSGWVTASVLDYLQIVEGHRPDVQSFNLDFYNLAQQERHGSLSSASAQTEWFAWLDRQVEQRPLCFIEPLPAVPERFSWTGHGLCWRLFPVP